MRVLVISDQVIETLYSPTIRQIARGVEFVVSCGDLPSQYLEYIVSVLEVPLFYVMGNHGAMGGEKEFPEGCTNLDGRTLEYKDVLLAGLEGSIRYNTRRRYQFTEEEMWAKIAALTLALMLNKLRYGRYLDICVTHAPPYGIHDGQDLAHHGFKSFLWLMDHYRPTYLLHGHQHLYDPRAVTQTIRGRTLVVNAFGYKIIEIRNG